jgi:hypothetical protein
MNKNIWRQSVEEPAENLLITSNPRRIIRIFNSSFLAIGVFYLDLFIRCFVGPFNQLQNASTAKSWDDQGFPNQRVLPGEQLGGGRRRVATMGFLVLLARSQATTVRRR